MNSINAEEATLEVIAVKDEEKLVMDAIDTEKERRRTLELAIEGDQVHIAVPAVEKAGSKKLETPTNNEDSITEISSTKIQDLNLADQITSKSLDQSDKKQPDDEEIAKNSAILLEVGMSLKEQNSRFQGMAPSMIIKRQQAEIKWWKGFQKMNRRKELITSNTPSNLTAVDGQTNCSLKVETVMNENLTLKTVDATDVTNMKNNKDKINLEHKLQEKQLLVGSLQLNEKKDVSSHIMQYSTSSVKMNEDLLPNFGTNQVETLKQDASKGISIKRENELISEKQQKQHHKKPLTSSSYLKKEANDTKNDLTDAGKINREEESLFEKQVPQQPSLSPSQPFTSKIMLNESRKEEEKATLDGKTEKQKEENLRSSEKEQQQPHTRNEIKDILTPTNYTPPISISVDSKDNPALLIKALNDMEGHAIPNESNELAELPLEEEAFYPDSITELTLVEEKDAQTSVSVSAVEELNPTSAETSIYSNSKADPQELLNKEEMAKNSVILMEMGVSLEEQRARWGGMAASVVLLQQRADIKFWRGFQGLAKKKKPLANETSRIAFSVNSEKENSREEAKQEAPEKSLIDGTADIPDTTSLLLSLSATNVPVEELSVSKMEIIGAVNMAEKKIVQEEFEVIYPPVFPVEAKPPSIHAEKDVIEMTVVESEENMHDKVNSIDLEQNDNCKSMPEEQTLQLNTTPDDIQIDSSPRKCSSCRCALLHKKDESLSVILEEEEPTLEENITAEEISTDDQTGDRDVLDIVEPEIEGDPEVPAVEKEQSTANKHVLDMVEPEIEEDPEVLAVEEEQNTPIKDVMDVVEPEIGGDPEPQVLAVEEEQSTRNLMMQDELGDNEEIAKNSLILLEMGVTLEEQETKFKGLSTSSVLARQRADIKWWRGFHNLGKKSGFKIMN